MNLSLKITFEFTFLKPFNYESQKCDDDSNKYINSNIDVNYACLFLVWFKGLICVVSPKSSCQYIKNYIIVSFCFIL